MENSIDNIYQDLREGFVVVGLTGAIGSGCSTIAELLSEELTESDIERFESHLNEETFDSLEPYRARKIKTFIKERKWKPFYQVKVSNLLFAILFAHREAYESEKLHVSTWFSETEDSKYLDVERLCQTILDLITHDDVRRHDNTKRLTEHLERLDYVIQNQVKKSNQNYTRDFQEIGSSLREHGEVINKIPFQYTSMKSVAHVFLISQLINKMIKKLKAEGTDFFVIDALRNVHEINFFKARYSNFYLFAIQAEKEVRKMRVMDGFSFNEADYNEIVARETEKKGLHNQDINRCLSGGDIFITNNERGCDALKYNLLKYVSLIRKPGLFTPSKDERNMQIALTARYNSGCISRQVGACVVGKEGYVLGIGWNDVPEGSIPCLYRSAKTLLSDHKKAPEFSDYEISPIFTEHVASKIRLREEPFCFKDLENSRNAEEKFKAIEQDPKLSSLNCELDQERYDDLIKYLEQQFTKNFKNPTRERALHAEENAFLQSSKVGGGSLKGGTLYTTDSPCQLCAKKAMQLGIERIIYIDAYPDISNAQTLCSGPTENRPIVHAFEGVAESAFMKLFKPLVIIKDEIDLKS